METRERVLKLHSDNVGKISVVSKVPVKDPTDLSMAYTPGVAEACKEIVKEPQNVFRYTSRGNLLLWYQTVPQYWDW